MSCTAIEYDARPRTVEGADLAVATRPAEAPEAAASPLGAQPSGARAQGMRARAMRAQDRQAQAMQLSPVSGSCAHPPVRRVGAARAGRAAPVRLTRRGRLVLVLGVLALAFAALTLLGDPALSTGQAHHAATETVVVKPGETLWEIAGKVAPQEDPRAVIAEIVDLNSLPDAGSIRVGQPLYVPAG
ncbi:MAG: LysM peptidoglycan-binding domain-containing protein [Nocardioidaceae bacterium]